MMQLLQSPEIILFCLGTTIGAIIWSIRLEGVVKLQKALYDAKLEVIEKTHEALKVELKLEVGKREEITGTLFKKLNEIEVGIAKIMGLLEKEK